MATLTLRRGLVERIITSVRGGSGERARRDGAHSEPGALREPVSCVN